jgi:hypothetical protein
MGCLMFRHRRDSYATLLPETVIARNGTLIQPFNRKYSDRIEWSCSLFGELQIGVLIGKILEK